MTDIPEDIREAAVKLNRALSDEIGAGMMPGLIYGPWKSMIEQALLYERMKERMRCARVAERWKPGELPHLVDRGFVIASAIRSGE